MDGIITQLVYVPESILVRQILFPCFILGGQMSIFFFVKTIHEKVLLAMGERKLFVFRL